MSNKENDAATVLTQMSQLVCPPMLDFSSYGLSSSEDDSLLDTDGIGATCTLQPSSVRDGLFPSLGCDVAFDNSKIMSDPYIGFDGAEHTYAVNYSSVGSWSMNKKGVSKNASADNVGFDGAEHTYAIKPTTTKPMKKRSKTDAKSDSRKKIQFECPICGKVFKTKQHYATHTNFHLNKKPHVCEQCGKAFTTKSDLKRHNKIHEKKQSVYKCEKCHATFRDLASKTRHQRKSVHTCAKCGKEFNRIDSYKDHIALHENKKPFKCDICNRKFAYKSSFNRHLLKHNDDVPIEKELNTELSKKRLKMKIKNVKASTKKKKKNQSKGDRKATQKKSKKDKTVVQSLPTGTLYHSSLENDSTEEELEDDINAIPILTSMAENAANTFSRSSKLDDSFPFHEPHVFSEMTLNPVSHIDSEIINLLDDSSTEEDCNSVISEDSDYC